MNVDVKRNPSPTEIDLLQSGLKDFNKEFGTEDHANTIGVFAKDELGKPVGGAVCGLQYTSCYIHLFWISPCSKGRGLGSAVFEALVQECKTVGVKDIFLDTFSFQNKGFYERLGFTCVGCLRNYPKQGIDKYYYHIAIS